MPSFRSQLEVKVAGELDHLGVAWEYEVPVKLPDGRSPRYLPDFLIKDANDDLRLPMWVECKPQDFLYSLRDLLGVTRRYGDRFSGEVECSDVTASDLRGMMIEELWKPKLLAEMTGESVLVVGTVGGMSSLSIEMAPNVVRFSRAHPFVNWVGIQKAKERERREREWEVQRAERQRLYEETQANIRAAKMREVEETLRFRHLGPTKWGKSCFGCSSFVNAGSGSLRKVLFTDGSQEWRVLCNECRQGSTTTAPPTAQ